MIMYMYTHKHIHYMMNNDDLVYTTLVYTT